MAYVAVIDAELFQSPDSNFGGFVFTTLLDNISDENAMIREAEKRLRSAYVSQAIKHIAVESYRKATTLDQIKYLCTRVRLLKSEYLGATWYPLDDHMGAQ